MALQDILDEINANKATMATAHDDMDKTKAEAAGRFDGSGPATTDTLGGGLKGLAKDIKDGRALAKNPKELDAALAAILKSLPAGSRSTGEIHQILEQHLKRILKRSF